jgi:hypothetical protein
MKVVIDGKEYTVAKTKFLGNSGGQSDDSIRGFGATAQTHLYEGDGIAITYTDNGAGVSSLQIGEQKFQRIDWSQVMGPQEIDLAKFAPIDNFCEVESVVLYSSYERTPEYNWRVPTPQAVRNSWAWPKAILKGKGDPERLGIRWSNRSLNRFGDWQMTVFDPGKVLDLLSAEDRAAWERLQEARRKQ